MSHNSDFQTVLQAFVEGRTRTIKNDYSTGDKLVYHSSAIAWREDGIVYTSLCGYDTVTTRARVNLVLAAFGDERGFSRVRGVLYFDGHKANASDAIALVGPLTAAALRAQAKLAA